MVELPPSKITQPFLASFITSFTRSVLGEMLNAFSENVDVFSVTTDGFLSNADDRELEKATQRILFKTFSDARIALDSSAEPLEVKHAVKQPIGWRTRGSATLQKGDGSNGIVLQKGGIKTNPNYDLEQENSYIVDLFLNRTPGQQLRYTIGIGVKDMIQHDTDFVSKSVVKTLSMEFDWKRAPIKPINQKSHFNGKEVSHLSFATRPVEDLDEYSFVRDAWDRFAKNNDGKKPTLKTTDDLENFEFFKIQGRNNARKKRVYAFKKDGDLKVLRQSLTRAFVQEQAGLSRKTPEGKNISYSKFAKYLTEMGIQCETSDVKNARHNVFEPNSIPSTPRSRNILINIQKYKFINLDIDKFFLVL